MTTIREHFGMRAVKGYTPKHGTEPSMVLPDQLIGVELEIEDFPIDVEQAFDGMSFTTDGSLRNNGMEIITAPTACKYIPASLKAFFKKFGITNSNYTERCSTHVHFNMQDFTPEQVAVICLLYQSTERLLFKFIGNDRDHSIFCVPWQQSNLTYQLVENLCSKDVLSPLRRWQKYSALNLLPLLDKGTIEFRHLHGTHDVDLISAWINLCSRLIKFAQDHSFEETKQQIINMNTVSNYRQWIESVFNQQSGLLFTMPEYELELERGIIECKYMLMGNDDSVVSNNPMAGLYGGFRPAMPRTEFNDYPPPPEPMFDDEETPDARLEDAQLRPTILGQVQADRIQIYRQNQEFVNLMEQMRYNAVAPGAVVPHPMPRPRTEPIAPRNPARRRQT